MRAAVSLWALALLVGCAKSPPAVAPAPSVRPPSASAAQPSPRAPVLVTIVVDQLAAWVADERLPALPPNGGFARLRKEGTWVHELTYLHASTETAPGHAALFTGRAPRETGIVGNASWRAGLGRMSQIEDPAAHLVDSSGRTSARGVSLGALTGPTLADALRARDPKAVVVSLSLKDRGAIFGGGRAPTLTAWLDESTAKVVTSDALFARPEAAALPDWVVRNAPPFGPGTLEWSPFDPKWLAEHARGRDDQPGESTDFGGNAFPHLLRVDATNLEKGAKILRSTPLAEFWLTGFALEALQRLRDPEHPMLLSLSLSTNDYVGHAYGPNSWEAWDELLRVDQQLARLFDGLDAELAPGGYALLLTGDHGVAPLPEFVAQEPPPWCGEKPDPFERPCARGARLREQDILSELQSALGSEFEPSPIEAVVESVVYLTPAARELSAPRRAKLDELIRATLGKNPFIQSSLRLDTLPRLCPPPSDQSTAALVCRATLPGRGDYYVIPKAGSFVFGGTTGTSHGTPYRYDRTVPLLVRYARGGEHGASLDAALFGSFYASAWYALTGEIQAGAYGGPIGAVN